MAALLPELRKPMVKKIALEEHFLDPATEPYWRPTMVDVAPAKTAQLYASLTDFGEQRLQMMDKAGIARAVLPIAGPVVQTARGSPAVRLSGGGFSLLFRNPRLLLEHFGSALPFRLGLFDAASAPFGWNLRNPPLQYLKENVGVPSSGVYRHPPVRCSLDALG